MNPNHHSLAYKIQAKPNKTYKDHKQKQKKKIAEWMFQSVCEYCKEYGEVPGEEAAQSITAKIYDKIKSLSIWVPYEPRIIENGICFRTEVNRKGSKK